jgi:uncharacterized protein
MNFVMKIIHDEKEREFYAIIDGKKAIVQYDFLNEKTVNIFHTYTPPEFRGHGVAKAIYDEISKWLVKKKLKAKLSCSYAQRYFKNSQD